MKPLVLVLVAVVLCAGFMSAQPVSTKHPVDAKAVRLVLATVRGGQEPEQKKPSDRCAKAVTEFVEAYGKMAADVALLEFVEAEKVFPTDPPDYIKETKARLKRRAAEFAKVTRNPDLMAAIRSKVILPINTSTKGIYVAYCPGIVGGILKRSATGEIAGDMEVRRLCLVLFPETKSPPKAVQFEVACFDLFGDILGSKFQVKEMDQEVLSGSRVAVYVMGVCNDAAKTTAIKKLKLTIMKTVAQPVSPAKPADVKAVRSPPDKRLPHSKVLLRRCLDLHRGGLSGPPANIMLVGSIERRSADGDVTNAEFREWFVCPNGDVREQMVTWMCVSGSDQVSIRGFDGRRHFVVTRGLRTSVDGKPSFKVDLANIKRDLALMRFLVDHFLTGGILCSGAEFTHLGRAKFEGHESHKIGRATRGQVTAVYFLNAEPHQEPFLLGIEYPATQGQPRSVHVLRQIKAFGELRLPQEIKITESCAGATVVSIWITEFRTDVQKVPKWADIAKYPRKR